MILGAARLGFWFNKPAPEQQFVFSADYIVITYTFTDGADLDTRTKMTTPDLGGIYVGWGQSTDQNNKGIVTWGGDNTGTGVESALINMNALVTQYPGTTSLSVECRCQWYSTIGVNPVSLTLTMYKGGTMIPGGYTWTNPTATESKVVHSAGKQIIQFSTNGSDIGEYLGTIDYSINTGIGNINV